MGLRLFVALEAYFMVGKLVAPRCISRWTFGIPMAIAALLTAQSCGGSSAHSVTSECIINSDCAGTLVCAFGRCHVACTQSKDCSPGETCLPPGVCELSQEATCSSTLPCVTGLTCANDVCRAACSPGIVAGNPGGCLEAQTCNPVSGDSTLFVCIDSAGDGGASSG